MDQPRQQLLIEDATRLPVEIACEPGCFAVERFAAEVGAYNNGARGWHTLRKVNAKNNADIPP